MHRIFFRLLHHDGTSEKVCESLSALVTISLYLLVASMQLTSAASADDLRQAISQSDKVQLLRLLESGADPDGLAVDGLPPLLLAWQQEDIEAFEILLEMGANLHQVLAKDYEIVLDDSSVSTERDSPIHKVIFRYAKLRLGFAEVALRYIRLPNQVDEDGRTMFHHIASNPGRISSTLIALMVNSGVDSDCVDKNGLGPARVFFRKLVNTEEGLLSDEFIIHVIAVFLMSGTDLMHASADGTSLSDDLLALQRKHSERPSEASKVDTREISKMMRPFEKNYLLRSRFCISPLLQPMFPELPRLINRKTMYFGKDINVRGKAGVTPLWLAIHCNLVRDVPSLVRDGADPDLRLNDDLRKYASKTDEIYGFRGEDDGYFGAKGETVVMAACTNPIFREIYIPLLIKSTKEPNQTDQLGRNLLHRLLYHPLLIGQEHLVNDLVKAGVDLNAQTISGSTPAHVAVALNPKVIPVLVELGADPNIRDIHNRTVEDLLSLAIREGYPRQDDYQTTIAWLRDNQK